MSTEFFVSFLLSLLYIAVCNPVHHDAVTQCKNAYGISEADLQELQMNNVAKDETNENQRCFVVCVLSRKGAMEHGDMKMEVIVPETMEAFQEKGYTFDDEEFKKGVEQCNNQTGDGKCEKSYKTWKCFLEFTAKYGLQHGAQN